MENEKMLEEYLQSLSNTKKYEYLVETVSNIMNRDKAKFSEAWKAMGIEADCNAQNILQGFTAKDVDDLLKVLILKMVRQNQEKEDNSLVIEILKIKSTKRTQVEYSIEWANSIFISKDTKSEVEDIVMYFHIKTGHGSGCAGDTGVVSIKDVVQSNLMHECKNIDDVFVKMLSCIKDRILPMLSYYQPIQSVDEFDKVEIHYNFEEAVRRRIAGPRAKDILKKVLEEKIDE